MRNLVTAVTTSILVLYCSASSAASEGLTEETGKEILDELRQIKNLLQGQQRGARPGEQAVLVQVKASGAVLGRPDAPITMIEFTDYQCPFCRQFSGNTFPSIRTKYIDTGKIRFISRNLPLPIHPDARNAAHAAICAGEQGRYWEMREILFQNTDLGVTKLPDYASTIGLDTHRFRDCLSADKTPRINSDVSEANAIGISGTPSFVIGRTTDGEITGERVVGALPLGIFETKINALLEQIATGRKTP